MPNNKPKNIGEYKKWLKKEHGITVDRRMQQHFDTVVSGIERDFEQSDIWQALSTGGKLRDFDEEYKISHENYPLVTRDSPELQTKSFSPFLEKTFRQNVLDNKSWPDPPPWSGHAPEWILPSNWFIRVNDLVRTCFVVRYLDGVQFLLERLGGLCSTYGLENHNYFVAGDDGYYAAHLYVRDEFEVPKVDWDTETLPVSIELQISTQLQDVIRKMLHKHYEKRRKESSRPDGLWQWDYKSNEFATNYLGHILHYVEGMIVEVRDKQKDITDET